MVREQYARGEIDEETYRQRLNELRRTEPEFEAIFMRTTILARLTMAAALVSAPLAAQEQPLGHPPASAAGCPDIDQDLVERGKEVYAGAGSCFACHGGEAEGGPLGPDLLDDDWLNVDGSYESIAGVIQTGVSSPQQFPVPMPPMGGARLSQEQVCAAAAYIYSLSR